MNLKVVPGSYSIFQLEPSAPLPKTILESSFFNISKTGEELSIVCLSELAPTVVPTETEFALIKVEGPLDFSLTGILASLANPLAEAKISIFAISTFDTDYLLVRCPQLGKAKQVLEQNKFQFIDSSPV